ncbi:MAG: diacylglycerol/lipid kinase family protein, partial [Actinomycetota bacterium]
VATGLAGSSTALMMLPGGSTNVFVRSLGAANDPVLALQQFSAGLDHDNIHPISLGRANGRYFCFHAGIGFDDLHAMVASEVLMHCDGIAWIYRRCERVHN